jgi:hypothetical protein
MPTQDASKKWTEAPNLGKGVYEAEPSYTTKTEKQMQPVVLAPATDKHPAQVKESSKDVVVGTFCTTLRSGEVTAAQKAEVLERIDDLLVEIKSARMRANETEVVPGTIAETLVGVLLEPLR